MKNPKILNIKNGKKNPFNSKKTKSYKFAANDIIAKPAIAKNILYSIDKKVYVSAFSLKKKKILWKSDVAKNLLNRNFNSGGILFSDGKLYVTNNTKYLMIIDATTGQEIMRKKFPDALRTKPVMANDNILLLQTISNQLVAYDIKLSKILWINHGGIQVISTKNKVHPTVNGNYVLTGFTSGEVTYIDVNSGKEQWIYDLKNDVSSSHILDSSTIVTQPIIDGNYVYFASSNGKIVKIDLDNGGNAWEKKLHDVQSMSLVDDILFITTNARQIAALSAHNAQIQWVGKLISEKDQNSKKIKTTLFQKPFIVQKGNGFSVNVIAANGELYQFNTNSEGVLPNIPKVLDITKNVQDYWISCCTGKLYKISNTKVNF